MDSTPLVDRDIAAGRDLIVALDRAGFPLPAAMWNYIPDERDWRLVLVTPWADARGPLKTYTAVQKVLGTSGVALPLMRIAVVGEREGFATELRIFMGTDGPPFVGGVFLHDTLVGDAFISATYVYRAQRIVGVSDTISLMAGTYDRARKVWVARPVKAVVEKGFFQRIETDGPEWPQTQARFGISANVDVLHRVRRLDGDLVADLERWKIRDGRLRGIEPRRLRVPVADDPAVPTPAPATA